MILAGDVGGTKTNLGLFEARGQRLVPGCQGTYASRDFPTLEGMIQQFLDTHRLTAEHACIGVAGPVQNGRCKGLNLPWIVDEGALAEQLKIPGIRVINDLEATAYSLEALSPEDLVPLNRGAADAAGNRAVIAAGTGLGEAGVYWDGKRHRPFAGEGGHCDFGARDALEAELLQFMLGRYEHVSTERVLSGSGLVDMYAFFRQREPALADPGVAEEIARGDAAASISRAGLEKRCPICEKALERFTIIYGAEAGNLALKMMATGGVYVGGGIAPKIIDKLKQTVFIEAFFAKGRMRYFMEAIPVFVIMTDRAALIGAAEFARISIV